MNLFTGLFSALEKHSVRYLIVGGFAVNLYGIERATADIDIIMDFSRNNIDSFIDAVNALGLKPKMPVLLHEFSDEATRKKWHDEKGMEVFSLYDPKHPFFLLDVIIEPTIDFNDAYKRKKRMNIDDTHLNVISVHDLLAMKEKTQRPQDVSDMHHLRMISKKL